MKKSIKKPTRVASKKPAKVKAVKKPAKAAKPVKRGASTERPIQATTSLGKALIEVGHTLGLTGSFSTRYVLHAAQGVADAARDRQRLCVLLANMLETTSGVVISSSADGEEIFSAVAAALRAGPASPEADGLGKALIDVGYGVVAEHQRATQLCIDLADELKIGPLGPKAIDNADAILFATRLALREGADARRNEKMARETYQDLCRTLLDALGLPRQLTTGNEMIAAVVQCAAERDSAQALRARIVGVITATRAPNDDQLVEYIDAVGEDLLGDHQAGRMPSLRLIKSWPPREGVDADAIEKAEAEANEMLNAVADLPAGALGADDPIVDEYGDLNQQLASLDADADRALDASDSAVDEIKYVRTDFACEGGEDPRYVPGVLLNGRRVLVNSEEHERLRALEAQLKQKGMPIPPATPMMAIVNAAADRFDERPESKEVSIRAVHEAVGRIEDYRASAEARAELKAEVDAELDADDRKEVIRAFARYHIDRDFYEAYDEAEKLVELAKDQRSVDFISAVEREGIQVAEMTYTAARGT